jgi:putative phage-type endonuclease
VTAQRLNTHGIGASEISAICSMNPYASPWDVWQSKLGLAPPISDDDSEALEWGHRNEPAIRQKYADTTGALLYVPPESLYHDEHTWARATPDAVVLVGPVERPRWSHLVQAKNVGYWPGKDWNDGPPAYVQLQEQWEMLVTGLVRADVAVLIAGSEFRVYTILRDDKMIADLVAIGAEFWGRVERKEQPPIDASEACRKHFESRLNAASAAELIADEELEAEMAAWHAKHLEAKRIERDMDKLRNNLRRALGDAQASRLSSSHGTAALRASGGGPKTNWKLIAELIGSTKCTEDEYAQLVAANTTTTSPSLALYPPAQWGKERL